MNVVHSAVLPDMCFKYIKMADTLLKSAVSGVYLSHVHTAIPCVAVPNSKFTWLCPIEQLHVSLFHAAIPCVSLPCSDSMCLCSMQQFHVFLFHAAITCISVPCRNSVCLCSMQQFHVSLFHAAIPCVSVPCSNSMCLCSMQQFHVSLFHAATPRWLCSKYIYFNFRYYSRNSVTFCLSCGRISVCDKFLNRNFAIVTGIIRLPGCECLTKPIKISSRKFSIYLEKVSEKVRLL